MSEYIEKLTKVDIPSGSDDQELNEAQATSFKSALQRVRWATSQVVPELAYSTSALAQGSVKKVLHLRAVNELTDRVQALNRDGQARLIVRPLDIRSIAGLTIMDASFAKEEECKSQMGYFNLVVDKNITEKPVVTNIVEYSSTTISRVVRSTMAAESASLSQAVDRQLYLRWLLESLIYGEPDVTSTSDWRMNLKIPGIVVTDAKSLFDHLNKTGSIPTERRTLIDLLVARDLQENNAIMFKWLPNSHMLADVLTKATRPNDIYIKFRDSGMFSLVPTTEQTEDEEKRLQLRQGQRQRAKARKKAAKAL